MQNSYGMRGTGTIGGRLHRHVQRRIRFDVALVPICDDGVNVCRQISRQKYDDVAVARSELRCARKPHVSASGRRIGINPRGNRAAGSRRLQGASHASQANAPAARFQLHRAGDVHDADAASAGLRVYRAAHLAEIDLSAAGAYADVASGMSDSDVAAGGVQFRASPDLAGADMTASSAQ